jgi:hypothetical protein
VEDLQSFLFLLFAPFKLVVYVTLRANTHLIDGSVIHIIVNGILLVFSVVVSDGLEIYTINRDCGLLGVTEMVNGQ